MMKNLNIDEAAGFIYKAAITFPPFIITLTSRKLSEPWHQPAVNLILEFLRTTLEILHYVLMVCVR